jgi:molybdate transport system permease protein
VTSRSVTQSLPELGKPRAPWAITLSDAAFLTGLSIIGAAYILLILSMLAADAAYMIRQTFRAAAGAPQPWLAVLSDNPIVVALSDRKIQYSIWLSMISCTLSAILSVIVAVPLGYLMSRYRFFGQRLLDAVLDIPIVLPPLVVGLSLLILFQFPPFSWLARDIVYQVPAVIVAQFSVACAFAVRTMKATFDHIDPRCEQVALSLGCSRVQAFGWVVLPEAGRGMTTALTLAWARSLGEFGPLLIFAGTTRMKTEVLSTTVFLEMNVGNLEAAVAVSLIMVIAAVIVLIVARLWGSRDMAL